MQRVLFPTGVSGTSDFFQPCSLPIHPCGGDLSAIGDIEANTQVVTEVRQQERQNPSSYQLLRSFYSTNTIVFLPAMKANKFLYA